MEKIEDVPPQFAGCEGLRVSIQEISEGIPIETPVLLLGILTRWRKDAQWWDYELYFKHPIDTPESVLT